MARGSRRWRAALAWSALVALAGCGDDIGRPGGSCRLCAADGAPSGGDAGPCACDAGPSLAAVCDDGNACTADTLAVDGCHFDPVADGTLCEDGDLCTLGDTCRSGQCAAGGRAAGELALLGDLENLSGRWVPLAANRFVVVTREDLFRGRVQVVSRTGDQLTTLAAWQGELVLAVLGDEDILADAIESTGIVAVAELGGRELRLFSASDRRVTALGRLELGGQIASLAGHGDRLWLCTSTFGAGWAVTLVDLARPRAPRATRSIPLGDRACGSVAVSQDGHRVYVNTVDGVRVVDAAPLDTGGDPTLSEVIAAPAGVAISGSALLLLAPTAVRVLADPTLDELATVPVAGPRAAALFGDRLLVEGIRDAGTHLELTASWYRALGGAPTLLDEAVLATAVGEPSARSYPIAADGLTLVAGTHAFELAGDRLAPLRIPELFPLRTLRPSAPAAVRAYGYSGTATVDLSVPSAPRWVAGGPFAEPQRMAGIALDDSLAAPAFVSGLAGVYEDSARVLVDAFQPDPLPIHRWTLDPSGQLAASETTTIPHEGRIHLLAAGDFIYRFDRQLGAPRSTTSLQAFWLQSLHGSAPAAPVFDVRLAASPPGTVSPLRSFDVDPRARIAVLSSEAETGAGDLAPALLFYDLSTSPPTLLGTVATDRIYTQVRIAGTRVVAASYGTVAFFDLAEGALTSVTSDAAVSQEQLLAFDGATAYLAELVIDPGVARYFLSAYPFDSATPVRVEVDALARSLAPTATGLAVGFETELRTLHPHCPAP